MNRWLGTILQYDCEIVHVPGKKNVIPDALSRYPQPEGWAAPEKDEEDLEPFVDSVLDKHEEADLVAAIEGCQPRILIDEYSNEWEEIAIYLRTLRRPSSLRGESLRRWTKAAAKYFVRE
ncbi:hypothetical protein COCCADRAFT_67855, partial [Bipolaris zeicola 26-R-13]